MNSKESMYSWHLSLRVDRPVEVSELFVHLRRWSSSTVHLPLRGLFGFSGVRTILLHSVTPTHRLRAPIFLLGGSSRFEKVSSGPMSSSVAEAGGAFGSRALYGSIKIFHCPSIYALPLNVGGMTCLDIGCINNILRSCGIGRTAVGSRIHIN